MASFKGPRSHWIATIKLVTRSRYLDHEVDIPFFSLPRPSGSNIPAEISGSLAELLNSMIIVEGKPPLLTIPLDKKKLEELKRIYDVDTLLEVGTHGVSFVITDLLGCDLRSSQHPEIINALLVGTKFIKVPAYEKFPVNKRSDFGRFLM